MYKHQSCDLQTSGLLVELEASQAVSMSPQKSEKKKAGRKRTKLSKN